MTLLILFALFAVCVSFMCSLLESVILSVSPAYIAVSLNTGKKSAQILNKLKQNIDQSLAAILTVNTIANTMGAAGVGVQVHVLYGDGYLAITSVVLTLTILIVSEIIPKTIGALKWKTLAAPCAYMIQFLITLVYPFVFLSRIFHQFFSQGEGNKITREEMIVTAEIGANEGSIRQKESQVIRNLLMLDRFKVSDIMTPRSVLMAFDITKTVEQTMNENKTIRFSRIPLFESDLDNIKGVLHRYKLMEAASHDLDDLTLDKLMAPLHTVPEDISVSAALDQFIKRKEHLFLVVDDYGSTAGIVTLEDTIETLLGVEIVDEFDSVEDMRAYALEKWRARKQSVRQLKSDE